MGTWASRPVSRLRLISCATAPNGYGGVIAGPASIIGRKVQLDLRKSWIRPITAFFMAQVSAKTEFNILSIKAPDLKYWGSFNSKRYYLNYRSKGSVWGHRFGDLVNVTLGGSERFR